MGCFTPPCVAPSEGMGAGRGRAGQSSPSVTSRCRSLLFSISADVHPTDDVIAFGGVNEHSLVALTSIADEMVMVEGRRLVLARLCFLAVC